jgi:glycerol kinase
MTDHVLAIHQGGHASRALLFDAAGRRVAAAEEPVATLRDAAGHVEHDPVALAGSVAAAVARVCADAARHGLRIRAAGIATQRSSIACWDRASAEPCAPVISWQDRRQAQWLEHLRPHAAEIRRVTGLPLNPHYGASKLRWCLDHLPAVQAAARAGSLVAGPLASFLLARLLPGHPAVADPANASRTQLWDPRTGDWSPALCALFGVARELLPRCVASRHDYGLLPTPAGDVPLVVATGDQSAALFAQGAPDPATLHVNVGTGAFLQRCTGRALPDRPRLLASVVWSDANGVEYVLEGTVNGAGAALDWLAAEEGTTVPALLAEACGGNARETPLFLNGVSGIGSPFWAASLQSRFVGAGDRAARSRAVLESIAFLILANLEEMAGTGPPLARIGLSGGFAANDSFCRALASLSGLPVTVAGEPEATARGLAWLVAGRPVDWTAAPPGATVAPLPDAALADRYRRWRDALASALR